MLKNRQPLSNSSRNYCSTLMCALSPVESGSLSVSAGDGSTNVYRDCPVIADRD